MLVGKDTYGKRVDHGLEAEVDFASANNLGDILMDVSERDTSY